MMQRIGQGGCDLLPAGWEGGLLGHHSEAGLEATIDIAELPHPLAAAVAAVAGEQPANAQQDPAVASPLDDMPVPPMSAGQLWGWRAADPETEAEPAARIAAAAAEREAAAAAAGAQAATAVPVPPPMAPQPAPAPPAPAAPAAAEGRASARKGRWLEYPAGSGSFATLLSQAMANTRGATLPGFMHVQAFRLQQLAHRQRGNVAMQMVGGGALETWSFSANKPYGGTGSVRLTFSDSLAGQIRTGDVLAVHSPARLHARYELWPAGSPAAQAFLAFEQTVPISASMTLQSSASSATTAGAAGRVPGGAGIARGAGRLGRAAAAAAMGEQRAEEEEGEEEDEEGQEEERLCWVQCDGCSKWRMVSEECQHQFEGKEGRCSNFARPAGYPSCTCSQACDSCGGTSCVCNWEQGQEEEEGWEPALLCAAEQSSGSALTRIGSRLKRARAEEEEQEEEAARLPAGSLAHAAGGAGGSGGGGGALKRQKGGAGKRGGSKFTGVAKTQSCMWRAHIQFNYKHIQLGTFASEEEAARAYDRAAIQLRGIRTRTNLPVNNATANLWQQHPSPEVAAALAAACTQPQQQQAAAAGSQQAAAAQAAALQAQMQFAALFAMHAAQMGLAPAGVPHGSTGASWPFFPMIAPAQLPGQQALPASTLPWMPALWLGMGHRGLPQVQLPPAALQAGAGHPGSTMLAAAAAGYSQQLEASTPAGLPPAAAAADGSAE